MPIYKYKCNKCGLVFEFKQPINDKPLDECIKCCGVIVRVPQTTNMQFKGKGFHSNDYKRS